LNDKTVVFWVLNIVPHSVIHDKEDELEHIIGDR